MCAAGAGAWAWARLGAALQQVEGAAGQEMLPQLHAQLARGSHGHTVKSLPAPALPGSFYSVEITPRMESPLQILILANQ